VGARPPLLREAWRNLDSVWRGKRPDQVSLARVPSLVLFSRWPACPAGLALPGAVMGPHLPRGRGACPVAGVRWGQRGRACQQAAQGLLQAGSCGVTCPWGEEKLCWSPAGPILLEAPGWLGRRLEYRPGLREQQRCLLSHEPLRDGCCGDSHPQMSWWGRVKALKTHVWIHSFHLLPTLLPLLLPLVTALSSLQ
jgi:hypothetical protein